MKKLRLLVSIFAVAIVFSCNTLKVTSDYDRAANFSQYKTFMIDSLKTSAAVSQLNQDRLINAVRASLIQKGLTENQTDPDLLVSIATILKNKQSVSSNTDFYGYGGAYRPWVWGGGMGVTGYTTYNVQDYTDGSLIINIADAKTKNLIWEGIGNKEIDSPLKDPDTQIPAAVTSIMKNFPPGAAKN